MANRYGVDPALIGRSVELRFDPEDLTVIEVFHHGIPAGAATPFVIGRHVHPAVSCIQEWVASRSEVVSVEQYGAPPPSPAVSVVVTLYGRLDFIEQRGPPDAVQMRCDFVQQQYRAWR